MLKKEKGFTLIELLVVVAVIGILAGVLLPNALIAIQKSKQKETMRDIIHIATACADYATSTGYAPDSGNQSGVLQAGSNFVTSISPFFLKVCPINDRWGNPFRVYTGTAVSTVYNIPAEDLGGDDFLIVSLGHDGADGGTVSYTYQPGNPTAGIYFVTSLADFSNDLINLNGSWLHAPRIASSRS